MDFPFVNGKPYLHTKYSKIKLLSIPACKIRRKKEMERGIAKFIKCFTNRVFAINGFHGDNKFEKLKYFLSSCPLRIVASDEHVRTVERSSRTDCKGARKMYMSEPSIPKNAKNYD